MRLSVKYILFILILHATALLLSFRIFQDNKPWFIVSEVFILASLAFSVSLYRAFIRPLQLLMRGVDAIRDRDFNVRFLATGSPEMDKLIGVYNAMIDELRTERTKQEEQHFFLEKLIRTSPTGIVMLDFDEKVTAVNPRAALLMGLSEQELSGKSVKEIDTPLFKAIGALKSGASKILSLNDGRTYKIQKAHFVDRGFPRMFVMIEDLTSEILEAEKKAYGKVIRMMAHEVNNSVGPVNSILETAIQLDNLPQNVADAFRIAVERNRHLNLFMRRFADVIRLPEPRFEPVDLHETLRKVALLLENLAQQRQVRFEFIFAEKPLVIRADAAQIEQALINIVKNAIEAIDNEGVVRIISEHNPPGLRIEDSGKGIAPEVEPLLFTPFFTDKAGGQGIGLTLIREILNKHGFGFSLHAGQSLRASSLRASVTVFEIRF